MIPVQKAAPTWAHPLHYWRVITPAMSPWWMIVPLQHDSDVVIEEEREDSMDTDVPASPTAPTPLKETSMSEDIEAGDPNDHCSHMLEESTDQNPPHDSDPNEDKLLGPVTNISIPGGHSDDSITLVVSPGEDDL